MKDGGGGIVEHGPPSSLTLLPPLRGCWLSPLPTLQIQPLHFLLAQLYRQPVE
jgi:hypothetical protein